MCLSALCQLGLPHIALCTPKEFRPSLIPEWKNEHVLTTRWLQHGHIFLFSWRQLVGPSMPFKLFKQCMLVATKKGLTKKKNVVHNMHSKATPWCSTADCVDAWVAIPICQTLRYRWDVTGQLRMIHVCMYNSCLYVYVNNVCTPDLETIPFDEIMIHPAMSIINWFCHTCNANCVGGSLVVQIPNL